MNKKLNTSEKVKIENILNENKKIINTFINENTNILNEKSIFDNDLTMNKSLNGLLNNTKSLKSELNKSSKKQLNSSLLGLRVGVDYFVDDFINTNKINIMNFYDSLFKNNQKIHIILNK